jgi:DNA-binding winged helix-turn-helix (wHTH) protein
MASRGVFHFDEFALDVGERRLRRGTETVRLSPKAYDVLAVLVRQSGRLVTKDELLAHVWPESFVGEGILNVHVAALQGARRRHAASGLHRNRRAVRISLHRCSQV